MKSRLLILTALLALPAAAAELLNVSYDPTREFYTEYNSLFAGFWKNGHGGSPVTVKQSHGGSGKQARAVLDGLQADVVTLALSWDIDVLRTQGDLLPEGWQRKLPHNSSPYTSTIVFVVRKGNPKAVRDWGDLVGKPVQIITPNPKTGGGARWNYLAAWAWADREFHGDRAKILGYMSELFRRVPVLDSGARGSTTTFAQRKIGDVFLSWENEAWLIEREFPGQTEIIYPSLSILAEPPVAVVEKNARKHGNLELANAYLEHLFSNEGQELAAKYHYRPADPGIAAKHPELFPPIALVTIDQAFGGWAKAQHDHFDDGGTFDQIHRH